MARRRRTTTSIPVAEGKRWEVMVADVVDACAGLPESSFDACLCDPPYGLKFMGKKWDYQVPRPEDWAAVLRVLKPGAPLIAFSATRTYHRMACAVEDGGFEIRDMLTWLSPSSTRPFGRPSPCRGTGLKPGCEPAVLAIRPIEGTFEANVAKWGVGDLAIDASRVGTAGGTRKADVEASRERKHVNSYGDGFNGGGCEPIDAGRWPANVVMDRAAAALLDDRSGERPSTLAGKADPAAAHTNPGHTDGSSWFGGKDSRVYADTGGASRFFKAIDAHELDRFFYTAKASRRERGSENDHPTVKPVELARYFARLVLPRNPGRILVPFAGSGSEILGAMLAGWGDVVGIENDAKNAETCRWRVSNAVVQSVAVNVG